jgi:hypothetical protein
MHQSIPAPAISTLRHDNQILSPNLLHGFGLSAYRCIGRWYRVSAPG